MAEGERPTQVDENELSSSALESVPPEPLPIPPAPSTPRAPSPAPPSSGRGLRETPRMSPIQDPAARPRPPAIPTPASTPRLERPKASSLPPAGPWRATNDVLAREVEACAALEPTRAALLLAAQARIHIDALGDPLGATHAVARAAELAPDARFASSTWRWLAEQGADPALVLQRSRAELAHVGEARERTALLWQIAAIEEHAAFDLPSARRTIRELLSLDPNDPGAWETHAGLHLRSRSSESDGWETAIVSDDAVFGAVASALDLTAQTTDDDAMRAALHSAVGALRERYLADTDGALAALRRAIEADPSNASAQGTLEAILLRRRSWDEYARVVEAEAERTTDPRAAAECFERAGDVHAECIGDHTRAALCYGRAAALDGSDPGPVEKEIVALEAAARWDDLAAAFDRLLARLRDPQARAWTLVRLGGLHETQLHRPDDALAAYRLAVEAAPTFVPAVRALLRLARERGLTTLAVELERREADRIPDPFARAVRYAALAEVLETSSSRSLEDATTLYERSLALDVTNASAFDALDRIYRASGQWPRLIALYEAALASTADRRRVRSLRLELAELIGGRLRDPVRAADLLRAALDGPEDSYATLVGLARNLAAAGRWTEYVAVLEAQASMLGGEGEIAAVYRIGTALETRVKDPKRALATYEIVVDRAPRHEAAARAIVRIHEQESRFEKVVDAERRLLDLATRPEDVVEGLLRIASVAEVKLGRVDEAIAAYTEALKQAPAYAPAVAALERLLRGKGDYRRLAQALQGYADATTDPHAKVRAMTRAATILELCMDDSDGAIAAYVRALEASDGAMEKVRHTALWGLARLQETRGEWDGFQSTLVKIRALTSDGGQLRIVARLARNAELRLADLPRAADLLDEMLAAGAKPAAVAVDRLRVARLGGITETIATALATMAGCTTDARLRAGLHRVLALLHEYSGSVAPAVAFYTQLVARDPLDPQALDGLVRCAGATPSDHRLSSALVARARATPDLSLRTLLAFAGGAIDENAERAGDAEVAYGVALLADPDFLPVLDSARRLRAQNGDWAKAAALGERLAAASRDRTNAANAWLEAGAIYEGRLSNEDQALFCYRALLAQQPENQAAHARALALVQAVGQWAEAAVLLEGHATAVTDPDVKVRCLSQRAALLAGRLGDTPNAIVDLRRALAIRGDDDTRILEVLAVLEERTKNWQEALQIHGRVAHAAVDATVRRRGRLAEARILADELREHAKAKAILEELVLAAPDDRDAAMRLAGVADRLGDDARSLEIYFHLSTTGTSPERARALVALSDLKRSRPDGIAEAEASMARAFDLALADPTVIPVLEERAARDGDFRPFAAHAEAATSRMPPNTPGILPMRTALARALREQLGNPGAADRQLAAAIQAFPDSMPTRLALAAGLRGRNDEAALVELRRAVEYRPTAAEPFEALVTLTVTTGRPGIGAMLASAASFLGGANDEIAVSLADAAPLRPIADALVFEESMARFVGPSRAWLVRSILAMLEPFLSRIFPGAEQVLDASTRLPDSYPVVSDVRGIAASLGCPVPVVARGSSRDVMLLLTDPRALLFGQEMLGDTARAVAAFHAGRACSRMSGSGSVHALPRPQIAALIDAAAKPEADGPLVRDLRKRIGSAMPRKNKKELERIVLAAGPVDLHAELGAWEAEEARRALFTAVLMCRDLRAVGEVLAADAIHLGGDDRQRALMANLRLREVLEFVVSPAGWDAFKRIYGRA